MSPGDPGDADHAPAAGEAGSRALLEAAAAAAFPDVGLADLTALPGESRSAVGSVTMTDGERFVLKAAPDADAATDLRREAAVTAVVGRETDVPVAAVVDAGFAPAEGPAYLVFRWVEGRTLQDAAGAAPPPVQLPMFRALGETMAVLHAGPTYETPGDIVPTGTGAFEVEPAGPWPEAFARELADHVEALRGTRFEALAEERWSALVDRLPALDTGEPAVLLHGDVGEGNVVYDGTEVACVLDWERAFVGHPEYDLCRAEVRYFWSQWGRRDALASALYDGYRARRDLADGFDARRRVYLTTFYLMSLSTFGDWGPRFADDLDALAGDLADKVRGVLEPGETAGTGDLL